jgi:hypothetical protein
MATERLCHSMGLYSEWQRSASSMATDCFGRLFCSATSVGLKRTGTALDAAVCHIVVNLACVAQLDTCLTAF